MAGWKLDESGSLPLLRARSLVALPHLSHGFTTRAGGVSTATYESLNLSFTCGDEPQAVIENRGRLSGAAGFSVDAMVYAEQVHGLEVAVVDGPQALPFAGADALVTATPSLCLTLLFADCYSIFFAEPERGVIAIAHSGWRGTAGNIVGRTAAVLRSQFGVDPQRCLVAVGPGIDGENYHVGADVADQFRDAVGPSGASALVERPGVEGSWELHLRPVIQAQLIAAGFANDAITIYDGDTYGEPERLFSHRRSSQIGQRTGRMAGFIGLRG